MANLPKWTIPFVSLGGISCRADIYDTTGEDYTGQPTVLIGQPQPVTFDEDTDDDLLLTVRTRTGYLNIIETAAQSTDIEALKPTTNVSRKVKVWYGQELIFVGFMQAQSFENQWALPPRQMSFPIQSPLALMGDISMPAYSPSGDTNHQGPRMVKLCELLDDIITALNGLGGEFTKVIWPVMSMYLTREISSLVVSPFNSDHDQTTISPELYKPQTCQYVMEGLCNCFGWMVHEAFSGSDAVLVFTKFDHKLYYNIANVSDIRTYTNVTTEPTAGTTQFDSANYFSPADNDGKESILMPYEKICLNYDGDVVKQSKFNFDHLSYLSDISGGNQYIAFLVSDTPELVGYSPSGHLLRDNYFDGYNNLSISGVNPSICGTSLSAEEGLLYTKDKDDTTCSDKLLFTMRFYDRPTASAFNIKFKCVWGKNLRELANEVMTHPCVGIKIRVGDKYYHGQGVWNTTPSNLYDWHLSTGYEFYWEDGLYNVPVGMPIEVMVYDTITSHPIDTNNYGRYLLMSDFRLETRDAVFSEQKRTIPEADEIKISNGYGQGVGDIYLAFSAYRENSNTLNAAILPRASWFTDYHYMLYSRECITLKCRRTTNLQLYRLYIGMLSFAGKLWRIVSLCQNPHDDETEIIIQRSLAPNE